MKKVLIYLYKNRLAPVGGQYGYNYNVYTVLEKNGIKNIDFLETEKGNATSINQKVNKIQNKTLLKLVKILKSIVRNYMRLYGRTHKAVVDLNNYDIVHFHNVSDMYSCKDSLEKYKGKVILTSHAPNRPSLSVFQMLSPFEQKYMKWFYKRMFDMDVYAFNRADYIVFPCPEAEEPYYNNWDYYKEFKKSNSHKYIYIPTGINPCSPKVGKSEVRQRYGIPEEAFVFCYVGRHNEIKGYDTLKELGLELLKDKNVYFLVAGKEEPIKGLVHGRWIEVGWTNDPHSIICASDVFILPNRETYFDLIMLELISLGAIVLCSHTGGNKFFEKYKPNGIIQYSTKQEAIVKAQELMKLTNDDKKKLQNYNVKMYKEYFTSEVFTSAYLEFLDKI
jgi:glycosyltransferase involved in cell wall biosynthesis